MNKLQRPISCSVTPWVYRIVTNGKLERWHKSLKSECMRPKKPLSLEDARRSVGDFVKQYNEVRLHSAIQYVTLKDKLEGRAEGIQLERKAKLAAARERRKANWRSQAAKEPSQVNP